MLTTAVGESSRWGKTKALLAAETSPTPLQEKLDVLAAQIGHLGMATAVLTFVTMIGIYCMYPASRADDVTLYEHVLKAFIMGVTIVVVAVPEGLPLAVTLSLAYSTQKMMHDMNLIRVLAACETMGNATNICSDKTGTLTQNRMTVVEAYLMGEYYDARELSQVGSRLSEESRQCVAEGIAVNSTANVLFPEGEPAVVTGSKTEGALLLFLHQHLHTSYLPLRQHFQPARGDRLLTFTSARKRMSVVLHPSSGAIVYTKGAAEIVVQLCTHLATPEGVVLMTASKREEVLQVIDAMAKHALRTVAIAHRMFLPVRGNASEVVEGEVEQDLVLDGIMGIKDPLRSDVAEAVACCQEAGIFVRMVTGDNLETAKAIATECGILTAGGLAMEGPAFRKLTPRQLDAVLPYLQVLARSSPDDQNMLVTRLNGL
jgi:Ca2+-transporting ATPase